MSSNFYPQLFLKEMASPKISTKYIRDLLLSTYPDKYLVHSNPERIKLKSPELSLSEVEQDLKDICKKNSFPASKFRILNPSEGGNKSGQYPAIKFEIGNRSIVLIITSLPISKSSTEIKESLVLYFFSSSEEYEPITKPDLRGKNKAKNMADAMISYEKTLENIYKDIKTNGIQGIEQSEINLILTEIKNKFEYNADFIITLNNALSIGNYLRNSKFKNWVGYRDKWFKSIKTRCGKMMDLNPDKWCPMDIILVKPNSEAKIDKTISLAEEEENENLRLGMINNMFVDDLETKNKESLILAISLKEEKAQAGKATTYLKKLQVQYPKTEYKLTAEDNAMSKEQLLEEIIKFRKRINTIIKRNDLTEYIQYELRNPIDNKLSYNSSLDRKAILNKYACLKILDYILDKTHPDDFIFFDIVLYGLGLEANPTFFKMTGNSEGDSSLVYDHIDVFHAGGAGIELVNNPETNDSNILIYDSNNAQGVDLNFYIEFASKIYQIKIMIRSNAPVNSTHYSIIIELNKFKKIEDLTQ